MFRVCIWPPVTLTPLINSVSQLQQLKVACANAGFMSQASSRVVIELDQLPQLTSLNLSNVVCDALKRRYSGRQVAQPCNASLADAAHSRTALIKADGRCFAEIMFPHLPNQARPIGQPEYDRKAGPDVATADISQRFGASQLGSTYTSQMMVNTITPMSIGSGSPMSHVPRCRICRACNLAGCRL